MRKLLAWLGLVKPKKKSHYCDWPGKDEPLRISRTILPTRGYKNNVEEDKAIYAQTIIKV